MRIPLRHPCLLALACVAFLPASARRSVLPYRAVVEVSAAPRVGEANWREELAARVSERLRAKGCVAGVEEPGGTNADLRVHVRVEDLLRETDYGASLVQTVSPDSPPEVRDSRTARVKATLVVDLVRIPGEQLLQQKRMTVDLRRSPRSLGEDVEAALREEALEEVAARVAVVVCKAKAPAR